MIYEGERSGTVHRYELTTKTLEYSAGSRTRVSLSFSELKRISPGRGDTLYLVARGRQPLGIFLPDEKMRLFLADLLKAWKAINPHEALKSYFDYGAREKRPMGWIILVVTLLFPGMLSLLLLLDAFNTLKCDARIVEQPKMAHGKITKISKNRRGSFVWTVEFTTESGDFVRGKRVPFFYDEKGHPKGSELAPIVYAGHDSSCWDVSLKPDEPSLNMTQRHFSLLMTMSFGLIFAALSTVGLGYSVFEIRRKYPYVAMIKNLSTLSS